MSRPPRPDPKAKWDNTTNRWYSPKEFIELQKQQYDLLKEEGFVDCEGVRKDGTLDTSRLSGHRSMSLEDYEKGNGGELSSEENDWFISDKAVQYNQLNLQARKAFQNPDTDWEVCVAAAMFADGYGERLIARAMCRSRSKVRALLAEWREVS